jgi:hypothetical protein
MFHGDLAAASLAKIYCRRSFLVGDKHVYSRSLTLLLSCLGLGNMRLYSNVMKREGSNHEF